MARADLLLNLVRAGAKQDQPLFRKSLEALVAEERAKQTPCPGGSTGRSSQRRRPASYQCLASVDAPQRDSRRCVS